MKKKKIYLKKNQLKYCLLKDVLVTGEECLACWDNDEFNFWLGDYYADVHDCRQDDHIVSLKAIREGAVPRWNIKTFKGCTPQVAEQSGEDTG